MSNALFKNIKRKGIFSALGPGLLYAGAAVGVSHLVQSTRAGADYGYSLIGVILIVNFLKFPFFWYGPRYAAATGKSLVSGYADLGTFALGIFAFITLSTMFIVQAAIGLVTAGLAAELTGIQLTSVQWALILIAISAVILQSGSYKLIDKIVRYIIIILSATTVIAVAGTFFVDIPVRERPEIAFDLNDKSMLFFLAALIGWMPAPFDIAVWHSVWSVEKNAKISGSDRDRNTAFDFHIGYWGTTFLALCFLILGARVLYGSGIELSASAAEFAEQLIGMYTLTLGPAAYPIIAAAAFAAMLSTTITVLDGFTRVMVPVTRHAGFTTKVHSRKIYRFWLVIMIAGTSSILLFLVSSMRDMVDLATTISFITAPILAYMNFKVIRGKDIPEKYKPGRFVSRVSHIGLLFLTAFSLYFIVLKLLP